MDAHASGGKPDEVAAAVAEARAAGEAQRDDEDMDAVRGELDEAAEDHTHLSASKERRLAARAKRDAVRHLQLLCDGCAWYVGSRVWQRVGGAREAQRGAPPAAAVYMCA